MIRTIHTLTLKDYSRHIETGDNRYLYKWWASSKQIEALKTEILELFQTDITNDLRSAVGKMQLWNTIITMQCVLDAIRVHLVDKVQLDLIAGRSTQDEGLVKLIEIANTLFGVEIKTLDDIQPLFDHLQFRIDKFEELYPKKQAEDKEPVTFTYSYQRVFDFMEKEYNSNMSIYEFSEMRKGALEKSKQLEAIQDKYKQNG